MNRLRTGTWLCFVFVFGLALPDPGAAQFNEVPLSSKQTELFKKFRNRRGKGVITTQLDIGRPVAVEGGGMPQVNEGRMPRVSGGGDR